MCWKLRTLSWPLFLASLGQGSQGLKECGEVTAWLSPGTREKKSEAIRWPASYHQLQTTDLLFPNLKERRKGILSNWKIKQNKPLSQSQASSWFASSGDPLMLLRKKKSYFYAYFWDCPKVFKFSLLRIHFSGYCSCLEVWELLLPWML